VPPVLPLGECRDRSIFAYLVVALFPLVTLHSPIASAADKTGEDLVKELSFLYVQSADAGSFDGQRLMLDGVGTTLFFSDRPARVSGHIDTDMFLGAWGADAGADSFASDPPRRRHLRPIPAAATITVPHRLHRACPALRVRPVHTDKRLVDPVAEVQPRAGAVVERSRM
jgi:hypothetical protein